MSIEHVLQAVDEELTQGTRHAALNSMGFPFGLPFWASPKEQKAWEERRRADLEKRLATATDWSDDIKWQPTMTIHASTYPTRQYFGGETSVSPSQRWQYEEKELPRGATLKTFQARRQGSVMFDAPIKVPMVKQGLHGRPASQQTEPWMSLTPMELLTLRQGTKLAKGHTVIAGLGLGHQAIEVSKKRQVRRITIVERDQELVDWLWPEIQRHMNPGVPVDIIVGDAYEILPTLDADVALIDIYPHWGDNRFTRPTPGIKKVWCWGRTPRCRP